MTIHELLSKFTPDEITFQRIDQTVERVELAKRGATRLVVLTNQVQPAEIATGTGKMGLLLWVPVERWNAIVAEMQSAQSNPAVSPASSPSVSSVSSVVASSSSEVAP
jgi:hypothetical protein